MSKIVGAPWVVTVAATTTPVASKAANSTGNHFLAGIIAQVDTAATTLTVKSGTTTLWVATLGIGTHVFNFPGSEDCPGMPALAKNVLVSAGLSAGTSQTVTIFGSTRVIPAIVTT